MLPEFGSITNPIDGTGAIYDDPALLPKIFDAILADPAPAGHRRKRRREAGRQRDDAALCPDIRRRRARVRPHRRRLSVQPARRAARFRDHQDAAWRAGPAVAGDIKRHGRAETSAAAARTTGRGPQRPMLPSKSGSGADAGGPRRAAMGFSDRTTGSWSRAACRWSMPRLAHSEDEAVAAAAPVRHRGRRQGRGPGPSAQERPRLRAAGLHGRAGRSATPMRRSSEMRATPASRAAR